MSTILKSLRKLEEEKKRPDKKLNLKEMMIREDGRPPVDEQVMGKPGHWWTGLTLLLTGLAIAGFMAFLLWPAEKIPAEKNISAQASTKSGMPGKTTSPVNPKTLGGVPLSSIPDFTQRGSRELDGVIEDTFIEEELSSGIETEIAIAPAVSVEVPEPVTVVVSESEPAPPMKPEANEQIIEALGQVPAQTRSTLDPTPEKLTFLPPESGESIEGLKLKGIIFFGEGSAENYLLFSYPGMSIHRLKVGESIANAKLTAIHPGLAVFEFEGRQIKLKVGS